MQDDESRDETDEDTEGTDADVPPGMPGKSDTPLGDTDQLSDANFPSKGE